MKHSKKNLMNFTVVGNITAGKNGVSGKRFFYKKGYQSRVREWDSDVCICIHVNVYTR